MRIVKSIIDNEIAIVELLKCCQLCKLEVDIPYTENLFILIKDNEILEICKKCYLKNK